MFSSNSSPGTILRVAVFLITATVSSGCASVLVEENRRGGPPKPFCSEIKEIREVKDAWRAMDGTINICVSGTPYRDYQGEYARSYSYEPKGPDLEYRLTIPAKWLSDGAPAPARRWGALPTYELQTEYMPEGCARPTGDTETIPVRKIRDSQRHEFDHNAELRWLEGTTPAVFDGHWNVGAKSTSDYSQQETFLVYRHSDAKFAGGRAVVIRHEPPKLVDNRRQGWIAAKPFALVWDIATFPVQVFMAPGLAFGYAYGQAHITPPGCAGDDS
jgi:hypothetical protein